MFVEALHPDLGLRATSCMVASSKGLRPKTCSAAARRCSRCCCFSSSFLEVAMGCSVIQILNIEY